MSRQAGRREPPKPEREAYVERLKSRRRRRPAQQETAGTPTALPVTVRRRWGAVALATIFVVFAFGALLTAIVEADAGRTANARTATVLAAALGLFSLVAYGVVSRAPKAMKTTLLSAPVAIGAFLFLGALLREPATPLVAAFGIAGSVALRPAPAGTLQRRMVFVLTASAIVAVTYLLVPTLAVSAAPLLPYFLPMVADMTAAKKAGVSMEELGSLAVPEEQEDDG
jgi:hypothetical protein